MFKRILTVVLSLSIVAASSLIAINANAVSTDEAQTAADAGVTSSGATLSGPSDFSWDNASVYFLLTDRFNNGNTSNDHSYKRGLKKDGSKANGKDWAKFHGGD